MEEQRLYRSTQTSGVVSSIPVERHPREVILLKGIHQVAFLRISWNRLERGREYEPVNLNRIVSENGRTCRGEGVFKKRPREMTYGLFFIKNIFFE